jgi:hypothetical protein
MKQRTLLERNPSRLPALGLGAGIHGSEAARIDVKSACGTGGITHPRFDSHFSYTSLLPGGNTEIGAAGEPSDQENKMQVCPHVYARQQSNRGAGIKLYAFLQFRGADRCSDPRAIERQGRYQPLAAGVIRTPGPKTRAKLSLANTDKKMRRGSESSQGE